MYKDKAGYWSVMQKLHVRHVHAEAARYKDRNKNNFINIHRNINRVVLCHGE